MDKTEQNKTETKKRVLYFDILNICATLGVVFLHTNGIAHTYSNTADWFQALAIEVLFYWPVPIFFMLSGATLMNYRSRYTTAEFFKKRFMRTVIPFVVWTLLTAAVKRINPLVIGEKDFINRCFNTSIENVYWFFIPLFAIYSIKIAILFHNGYCYTIDVKEKTKQTNTEKTSNKANNVIIRREIQVVDKNTNDVKKEVVKKLTYQMPEVYTQKEYVKLVEENKEMLYEAIIEVILIIIGVSLIGIINNQTVSFLERKREMAVLYSTAMSRSQLNKMIFTEVILSFAISAGVSIIFTIK